MANCDGKILFYVQHLYGVGHLFRAQRIAERLVAAGLSVKFVIGGEPVPGLHLPGERSHFLPPVRSADAAFSKMVDGNGDDLTAAYLTDRADKLLAAYIAINPDLILIEAFPFGRRFLRPELVRLLDAARKNPKPPLVCCSVRDILQENRKPGRAEEAAETINTYFDMVLVHGDPAVTRLEATFPATELIADKIRYTGIVADPASANGIAGTGYRSDFAPPPDDILVTAGGGAFGAPLLECAAEAAAANPDHSRHWCLVTGPNADPRLADKLQECAPERIETEVFIPNLAVRLHRAQVSVSQAGYNTVADLLAAPCKRVLVPSDIGGQSEQLRRATLLADAGLCVCLPESELTPERLLKAIADAETLPDKATGIDLSGAETSAALICDALAGRA